MGRDPNGCRIRPGSQSRETAAQGPVIGEKQTAYSLLPEISGVGHCGEPDCSCPGWGWEGSAGCPDPLLALEIGGVWECCTENRERPQSAGCPSDRPLKSPEQSCRGMSPAEGTPSPSFPLFPGADYGPAVSVKPFLDFSRGKMTCWKIHHSPLAVIAACVSLLLACLLRPCCEVPPATAGQMLADTCRKFLPSLLSYHSHCFPTLVLVPTGRFSDPQVVTRDNFIFFSPNFSALVV